MSYDNTLNLIKEKYNTLWSFGNICNFREYVYTYRV